MGTVNWLRARAMLGLCWAAALMAACGGGGGGEGGGPVAVAPTLTTQPQNVSVPEGQAASFSVVAAGTAPLTYQWRRNGVDVAGATGASHTTAAVAAADDGAVYSVVVSNPAGSVTSAGATLSVVAAPVPPAITSQPASASVAPGQSATFSVGATGTAPLAYQWQRNGADIAGASAASYTTPPAVAGDNGAVFRVVVGNAAGSVTSAGATLTVTSPTPASRFVEAWSGADANTATGSYTLGYVDPDAPAAPVALDQLPAGVTSLNTVLRILGGTYDAATGRLADVGVRHLVYVKSGRLWKVSLDKTGAAPAPVAVSNETQVETGSLQVLAQSLSGDEALLTYTRPGTNGVRRFVRLSTPASEPAQLAPQFAGDVLSPGWLIQSINDPATGAITGYLWPSFPSAGGSRLFRTDAAFGNPTSVGTWASSDFVLANGLGALAAARSRHGLFFVADGALRRYDFASGNVELVYPGVSARVGAAIVDDEAIYLRVQTAGGPQLVKAPDRAGEAGVAITAGAPLDDGNLVFQQTRDYLLLITASGAEATSVRKSDGLRTPLPAVAGGLFSWVPAASMSLFDGYSVGNRVFYTRSGSDNFIGSVLADGTDRKETTGLFTQVQALPASVAAHRLHAWVFGLPVQRVLIDTARQRRWIDIGTGEVGASVGTLPATYSPGFGCPKPPYGSCTIGRAGVAGRAETVGGVPRLDAWFLSEQAGSLQRLTNHVP